MSSSIKEECPQLTNTNQGYNVPSLEKMCQILKNGLYVTTVAKDVFEVQWDPGLWLDHRRANPVQDLEMLGRESKGTVMLTSTSIIYNLASLQRNWLWGYRVRPDEGQQGPVALQRASAGGMQGN